MRGSLTKLRIQTSDFWEAKVVLTWDSTGKEEATRRTCLRNLNRATLEFLLNIKLYVYRVISTKPVTE